jgi:cytochrome c oxidase assembly factor 4
VAMSSKPSGHEKHVSQDDEPDEWEQRIDRGGCSKEHYRLQDCYMETKDWRKCKDEVSTASFGADCRWKHSKHAGRKSQRRIQRNRKSYFQESKILSTTIPASTKESFESVVY